MPIKKSRCRIHKNSEQAGKPYPVLTLYATLVHTVLACMGAGVESNISQKEMVLEEITERDTRGTIG